MSKIRILIVDDHALVRAGLRALLVTESDFVVVGEAEDGVVVVEQCRKLSPDVVLLDLTMPGRGGIGALHDLRDTCPNAKVLIVSMHKDEAFVRQAMLAGAAGYVLKESLAAELLHAIRAVHRGQRYISRSLTAACLSDDPVAGSPRQGRPLELLTPREREVLTAIALGHTNLEIARRLCISGKTVETHRKHIATKLGTSRRADLVRLALDHGLIAA